MRNYNWSTYILSPQMNISYSCTWHRFWFIMGQIMCDTNCKSHLDSDRNLIKVSYEKIQSNNISWTIHFTLSWLHHGNLIMDLLLKNLWILRADSEDRTLCDLEGNQWISNYNSIVHLIYILVKIQCVVQVVNHTRNI